MEKIARHPFSLPVGTEEADNARATAPACAAQVLQDARGAVRRESQRRTHPPPHRLLENSEPQASGNLHAMARVHNPYGDSWIFSKMFSI